MACFYSLPGLTKRLAMSISFMKNCLSHILLQFYPYRNLEENATRSNFSHMKTNNNHYSILINQQKNYCLQVFQNTISTDFLSYEAQLEASWALKVSSLNLHRSFC